MRVIGMVSSRRRLSRRITILAAVPGFESPSIRMKADASSTVRELKVRMITESVRAGASAPASRCSVLSGPVEGVA